MKEEAIKIIKKMINFRKIIFFTSLSSVFKFGCINKFFNNTGIEISVYFFSISTLSTKPFTNKWICFEGVFS